MFNHHMPWGYNFLFTGYGESKERVNLDVLDVVDQQLLKTSENKGSLYPNLSNVWWKIIFFFAKYNSDFTKLSYRRINL